MMKLVSPDLSYLYLMVELHWGILTTGNKSLLVLQILNETSSKSGG